MLLNTLWRIMRAPLALRRSSWAAVALGMATVIVGSTAYSAVTTAPASSSQDSVIHRGGILRVGTAVYIHTNASHAAVGLTRVQLVNNCYLRVFWDRAPDEQVVSVIVEEDEALSKQNIQAGASGGAGYVNIYLYRSGRAVCANNRSLGHFANLWIDVQSLAPSNKDASSLKPAPAAKPPLEQQQKVVPRSATAPIPVVPATP